MPVKWLPTNQRSRVQMGSYALSKVELGVTAYRCASVAAILRAIKVSAATDSPTFATTASAAAIYSSRPIARSFATAFFQRRVSEYGGKQQTISDGHKTCSNARVREDTTVHFS